MNKKTKPQIPGNSPLDFGIWTWNLGLFILSFVYCMLLSAVLFAQGENTVEMADELRSSGKIYVVVTVLAVLFLGISLYLFLLDRKVTRIEKELKDKKNH